MTRVPLQVNHLYGYPSGDGILPVKVIKIYTSAGRQWAEIRTVNGERPWLDAGGTGEQAPQDTTRVPLEGHGLVELAQVDGEGRPLSLLGRALALAGKPQWWSDEILYVWDGQAFLTNHAGIICLHLSGYERSCPIFYLDLRPEGCQWVTVAHVEALYRAWVEGYLAWKARHPRKAGRKA